MVIGVGVRLAWVAPGAGAPSIVFTVVDEGTGGGVCIAPATGAVPGMLTAPGTAAPPGMPAALGILAAPSGTAALATA